MPIKSYKIEKIKIIELLANIIISYFIEYYGI